MKYGTDVKRSIIHSLKLSDTDIIRLIQSGFNCTNIPEAIYELNWDETKDLKVQVESTDGMFVDIDKDNPVIITFTMEEKDE